MLPDPADTIVALATPFAPGLRGIVRISGAAARTIADAVFAPRPAFEKKRLLLAGDIRLKNVRPSVPADLYYWPGPASYTAQDLVELHLISSPPLLEQLVADCLAAGARAALPGEFTMRAFLAGKLDLTQAEAVLGVIEAPNQSELKEALTQLAGGLAHPLQGLRDDLLNLLADVEAGLDFTDEDLQFVDEHDPLARLTRALAQITLVGKTMSQRASSQRPFQVALVGPPNAGKSSLFNALTGRPLALVHDQPGTTRDYLSSIVNLDGIVVELVDSAGIERTLHPLESAAQKLGQEQACRADLLLLCCEPGRAALLFDANVEVLRVLTKCDLANEPSEAVATSVLTGHGLDELRKILVEKARARPTSPLAPSLSRCRHHVNGCLAHLRAAHACVLHHDPAEILAVELRAALDELGAMVGAVYTDDLLDRIFSRFCIGK